jgi:zinc-ribbon domain
METCPNCGRPVEAGAAICPNCGARTRPPQAGRLFTGVPWLDTMLGFMTVVVSLLLFGIGMRAEGGQTALVAPPAVITLLLTTDLLVVPVLYLVLQRNYPAFTRGIEFAMLTLLAIALGALAICVALIPLIRQGLHGRAINS